MSKRYSIFIIALFCGFLFVFGAVFCARPVSVFSEMENRYLQTFPELTLKTLASGTFMTKFETFVTDQFPGRDAWMSAKTRTERLSGKKENNGVYFGTDGETLLDHVPEPDWERVEKNFGYIADFGEGADVPVYFALIPGKTSIWAHRLPENAPVADETEVFEAALETANVTGVDLYTPLGRHAGEHLYYRTDHHWTTLGAYYGYTALMEAMGIVPVSLSDYTETVVSERFYGTAYSASGARWVPPDSISLYVPEDGVTVTSYFTGRPEPGALYNRTFLEVKDKYSVFLGGNQPLCVIKTETADAPKLLIVRDSYADSLVPFLTAHFSEIHLIDPRYNRSDISDYIAENGIDAVIVLYGTANFVSDGNLFILGR